MSRKLRIMKAPLKIWELMKKKRDGKSAHDDAKNSDSNKQATDVDALNESNYEVSDDLEISLDLSENVTYMKNLFANCTDYISREFTISEHKIKCNICYIEGIVKKDEINYSVLRPLFEFLDKLEPLNTQNIEAVLKDRSIWTPGVKEVFQIKNVVNEVLNGSSVLFFENTKVAISVVVKDFKQRSIGTPMNELNIRGAFDAFNENITTNLGILRGRIKCSNFKTQEFTIGRLSKTKVVVAYIEGIGEEKVLEEIKHRLERIDIDVLLESENIETLIADNPLSPFPTAEATERPDAVMHALSEGRFAIFTDGTPIVLIVPSVFSNFLLSVEDYFINAAYANCIVFLRYVAFIIALLGPAVYIAISNFNPEMVPTTLLIKLASVRAEMPFPVFFEALLMEITFEILREASIRTPKAIGQTINLVGALVIGQTAIEAGIVSPMMLIVIAVTGISSFTVPKYNLARSIRFLRFPIMILGGILGMFGVILGVIFLVIHMTSLSSFKVQYLAPIAPMSLNDWKLLNIQLPFWSRVKRISLFQDNNLKRMDDDLKPKGPNDN